MLYQEPFRRENNKWEPTPADFMTDLRGVVAGEAAGWCLHNGAQAEAPAKQPCRSLDLRDEPLFEQLAAGEENVANDTSKRIGS